MTWGKSLWTLEIARSKLEVTLYINPLAETYDYLFIGQMQTIELDLFLWKIWKFPRSRYFLGFLTHTIAWVQA